MRPADFKRLSAPYPEALEPAEADAMAAIDLRLPNWSALKCEVWRDFTDAHPYGVRWWAPYLEDPKTRILISDQFYCCLASVVSNLCEAKLHWLEYLDAAERDDARLSDVVRMTPAGLTLSMPKPRSPYDQLIPDLMRMHRAGMVRALASALDCLAGVIIGATALDQSILKADFAQVRCSLTKIKADGTTRTCKQVIFASRLEKAISASGPNGWLDWTFGYRNMLVHRGRRIEIGQFVPAEPVVYGPDGHPARTRRISHLPRVPARSDGEVLWDQASRLVLNEDARQTLEGLMTSTIDFVEATATHMHKLWRWRRSHPGEIRQPAGQWPARASTQPEEFEGYQRNPVEFDPRAGMGNPVIARRSQAIRNARGDVSLTNNARFRDE